MKKLIPLLTALAAPVLFSACGSPPSVGDQLISQGQSTRALGEQWNKGNSMISEGEKQKKRGRKMIENGEDLIKKGERNIERGKSLKSQSEAAASAVS